VTRFSTAFALTSDLLMGTLGSKLKMKEKQTGRMADILGELYIISAVLKEAEDHNNPSTEAKFLTWNCQRSLSRIQNSLLEIMQNLPLPLRWLLRALIFPLGAHFNPPGDKLGHDIAATILEPGPLRDRLIQGLYLSSSEDTPDALLETALRFAVKTDKLEKKLRKKSKKAGLNQQNPELLVQAKELGIITEEEKNLLQRARELRRRVIAVDAF